jgi:hypothetical protein
MAELSLTSNRSLDVGEPSPEDKVGRRFTQHIDGVRRRPVPHLTVERLASRAVSQQNVTERWRCSGNTSRGIESVRERAQGGHSCGDMTHSRHVAGLQQTPGGGNRKERAAECPSDTSSITLIQDTRLVS